MTNLEYIRNMEVEKLAEFITDCAYACYLKGHFCEDPPNCPLYGKCTPKYGSCCCTEEGIAKWLNEERRTNEKDTNAVRENL